MKNKLELFKEASSLAESLLGEVNQRKIVNAIEDKFAALNLHDGDYPVFGELVRDLKARFEAYKTIPTETGKAAQKSA